MMHGFGDHPRWVPSLAGAILLAIGAGCSTHHETVGVTPLSERKAPFTPGTRAKLVSEGVQCTPDGNAVQICTWSSGQTNCTFVFDSTGELVRLYCQVDGLSYSCSHRGDGYTCSWSDGENCQDLFDPNGVFVATRCDGENGDDAGPGIEGDGGIGDTGTGDGGIGDTGTGGGGTGDGGTGDGGPADAGSPLPGARAAFIDVTASGSIVPTAATAATAAAAATTGQIRLVFAVRSSPPAAGDVTMSIQLCGALFSAASPSEVAPSFRYANPDVFPPATLTLPDGTLVPTALGFSLAGGWTPDQPIAFSPAADPEGILPQSSSDPRVQHAANGFPGVDAIAAIAIAPQTAELGLVSLVSVGLNGTPTGRSDGSVAGDAIVRVGQNVFFSEPPLYRGSFWAQPAPLQGTFTFTPADVEHSDCSSALAATGLR